MSIDMSIDYKEQRIQYINNWPHSDLFPIEQEYRDMIDSFSEEGIFIPLHMSRSEDPKYNIAISFIIDSLEMLRYNPSFSFEFIFKAYDVISKALLRIENITERNQYMVEHIWTPQITNTAIEASFTELLQSMPLKSCQFLYAQLQKKRNITRILSDGNNSVNQNRKAYIEAMQRKYGYDSKDYNNTIRKGSRYLYRIMTRSKIELNATVYNISLSDKLHLLISGLLYSMRNEVMHGSSMSSMKSSLAHMNTCAHSFFCFLCTYYLLMLTIFTEEESLESHLVELSDSIYRNKSMFEKMFGRALGE